MSVDEVVIVIEVPVFCPQCDVSVLFVSGLPYSPLSLSLSPALYAPPSSPALAVAFLMLATDAILGLMQEQRWTRQRWQLVHWLHRYCMEPLYWFCHCHVCEFYSMWPFVLGLL